MTAEAAFDSERWDRELGDDLAGLALAMAPEVAEPVSSAFGVEFDLPRAEAWLINNARLAAAAFNARTKTLLADASAIAIEEAAAPAGAASRTAATKTPRSAMRAQAGDVLDEAAGGRAAFMANERAAIIANYTAHEAADQSGARSKTWHTPGPRARPSHAALSGTTIPFEHSFGNGGRYPRDTRLSVGERAGCTCHLTYSTTDVDPATLEDARAASPGGMREPADFERWARSRRLDADLGDIRGYTTPDGIIRAPLDPRAVDDLNEIASTLDDLMGRFDVAVDPLDPTKSLGLRAIYTDKASYGAIPIDVRTEVNNLVAGVFGNDDGFYIALNSRFLGAYATSPLAESHYVLANTAARTVTHEFAHVVRAVASNNRWGTFTTRAQFDDLVKSAVDAVYGRAGASGGIDILAGDIGSPYALRNVNEAFAEVFLTANDAELFGRLTPTAQRRLRSLIRTINEGHRALSATAPDLLPMP